MEKYLAGFISPAIAPLALIALGMWIWAEFKCNVKQRLLYGFLSFLLCLATAEGVHVYGQSYERMYVRNSLIEIKDKIKTGNTQFIIEAINKFETNEKNRSFANAASGLWQDFSAMHYNQTMKKTSNQGDAPDKKTVW